MKLGILTVMALAIVSTGCVTGIGTKMSQATIDELQAGKGKLSKEQVRAKIGGAPQAQLSREGMECDSYAYTGHINYFIFSKPDISQSYNFCYDKTTSVLKAVDGMQK